MTSGIVVVDKAAGLTSHQVVGRARRLYGTRKIGHAGTLDPMATGVLLLGVNRATRLLGHLALHDKCYSATIRLGQSSNTDDADGEVEVVADAAGLDLATIDGALENFRGAIQQVPSTVSAIKVGGHRAYALARAGKAVELQPRSVTITKLVVEGVTPVGPNCDVDVVVECSSGTYIRALARDLGRELGVGGHLTRLRRTRIGQYDISEAHVLGEGAPPLMTMAEAAERSFPCLRIDAAQQANVQHGRSLDLAVGHDPTGIIGPAGDLLALYRPAPGGARPVAVLVG